LLGFKESQLFLPMNNVIVYSAMTTPILIEKQLIISEMQHFRKGIHAGTCSVLRLSAINSEQVLSTFKVKLTSPRNLLVR
jgi:hypothetical protein